MYDLSPFLNRVLYAGVPLLVPRRLVEIPDAGLSVHEGIAVAAGVPLLALAVCCFCGFLCARKKSKVSSEFVTAGTSKN